MTVSNLGLFGGLPSGSRTYVITSNSITDSSGSSITYFDDMYGLDRRPMA